MARWYSALLCSCPSVSTIGPAGVRAPGSTRSPRLPESLLCIWPVLPQGESGARTSESRSCCWICASNHPSSTFITDVATMNQMYVQNGFRLPQNVVCRNGPGAERNLLVNKEPPNQITPPGVTFPDRAIDGVLLNLNDDFDDDQDFAGFLAEHRGPRERIAPLSYKPFSRLRRHS